MRAPVDGIVRTPGSGDLRTSFTYRNDNRFQSDTDKKTRCPIRNPLYIGSHRVDGHSDSDTINDMLGGNMEFQAMMLPKDEA